MAGRHVRAGHLFLAHESLYMRYDAKSKRFHDEITIRLKWYPNEGSAVIGLETTIRKFGLFHERTNCFARKRWNVFSYHYAAAGVFNEFCRIYVAAKQRCWVLSEKRNEVFDDLLSVNLYLKLNTSSIDDTTFERCAHCHLPKLYMICPPFITAMPLLVKDWSVMQTLCHWQRSAKKNYAENSRGRKFPLLNKKSHLEVDVNSTLNA